MPLLPVKYRHFIFQQLHEIMGHLGTDKVVSLYEADVLLAKNEKVTSNSISMTRLAVF